MDRLILSPDFPDAILWTWGPNSTAVDPGSLPLSASLRADLDSYYSAFREFLFYEDDQDATTKETDRRMLDIKGAALWRQLRTELSGKYEILFWSHHFRDHFHDPGLFDLLLMDSRTVTSPRPWFEVSNCHEVPSPSLLVYPERVEENLKCMIALAGGVERLRPHMKTHKMPEMIRLQLARGITKFKCATIAEAEMTSACGAKDVLLAYQPVGPNAIRAVQLVQQYPQTSFAALADDEGALRNLSEVFSRSNATLSVLLDVDCGQHRCGVEAGPAAVALYRLIGSLPGLKAGGLHAYDGHIHDTDLAARAKNCETAFAPVMKLREELRSAGLAVPRLVAGGTPTFPLHAKRADVECSPGTCVFWDFGYADKLPDMDFLVAALVLTRVVSKPGGNRLCLDLGHKSIASENPHPRVRLVGLEDAEFVTHSEEHLVVETPRVGEFKVGDALYGIPRHICPTVALYSEAVVVRGGRAIERWKVTARERRLTI